MARTVFIPRQTLVTADWLNGVDEAVQTGLTPIAANVTSTPTGTVVATNVQAAIAELDTEKVSTTALAASTGAAGVGFVQAGAGAVARTAQAKMRERVSVVDFGAVVGDSGANEAANDAAFAAAKVYAASLSVPCEVEFPPGIYRVATDTNWFLAGLVMRACGKVVIKSSKASGNVMSVDAGAATNGYQFRMEGQFTLDTVAGGCQYGLYTRHVHHSHFDVNVRNVSLAGVAVVGAVMSDYRISCTVNPENMSTLPVNGLVVTGDGVISATTDCNFDLKIEGVSGDGVVLTKADCNIFRGTSEGNGGLGVVIDTLASYNIFDAFFMEANDVGDAVIYGSGNEFINCQMQSRAASSPYEAVRSFIIKSGAQLNRIRGSGVHAGQMDSGSVANQIEYVSVGHDITDAGTRNQKNWCIELYNSASVVPGFKPGNLDSSAVDVLDWYLEGTFTPSFGGSGGDGTLTLSIATGTYTRIGNIVHFSLALQVSVLTTAPTGDLLIRGLPLTASASVSLYDVTVGSYSNLTLPASRVQLTAYVLGGASYIRLVGCADGLAQSLVQGSGLAATIISVSGSYKV